VIPDEEIERVRDSADIVGIIGEYVPLKRVGSTFRGPCPFHQGTHRNFSVDPKRKGYKCFKCGEGGDVFTFLRKRLGVDWPTAVRMVAERSGIELREVQTRRDAGPDPRDPVWEVNASAQEYFERVLWDDEQGAAAREYLAHRAMPRDMAQRFGLGFAPRDARSLPDHLTDLGFDETRQLEAGLLVRREGSTDVRPRFRGRLMFPIYDVAERVVGFGGRILDRGEPKYLNSAESIAFTKGKLLYGLNWARNAIRRAERALLVEGYFDLIRLSTAGIEEVVAPLGTAMTPEQAELLTRYTKNVFLLYDSDKAGLSATFRTGDELLRHAASVRVVSLPEGEDPDTYVRSNGREGLERQIAQGVDVFERKIQLLERGAWFSDLHRRRRAIDRLLPTIRAASDPVTRDMYIGRAAEVSGVARRVLTEEAESPQGMNRKNRGEGVRRAAASLAAPTRPPLAPTGRRSVRSAPRSRGAEAAERELVRVMLALRSTVERIGERIGPEQFREHRYREIFEVLAKAGPDENGDDLAASLSTEATEVLDSLLAEPHAVQDVDRAIHDCITQIEVRRLQEENARLQRLLGAATEREKDKLVQTKQANVEEIRRLTESRSTS
jgi:DNA primase